MSQKLRRPILLVGVTGSPAIAEGPVKCRGGGEHILLPRGRVSPFVSDIVLRRLPENTEPIRNTVEMHSAHSHPTNPNPLLP